MYRSIYFACFLVLIVGLCIYSRWFLTNTVAAGVDDPPVATDDRFSGSPTSGELAFATRNLNNVNEPPIARGESYQFWGTLSRPPGGGLLLNDYDPEGQGLWTGHPNPHLDAIVVYPEHGNLSIDYVGGFMYLPFVGYTGADSFVYRVCDPWRACTEAMASLYIYQSDGAENAGAFLPCVGEPINVTNGNMWLEQADYSLPGIGESIEVRRFYNTIVQRTGLFGFGWTTTYDESLGLFGDNMIRLNMPDGRAVLLSRSNSTDPFIPNWPLFYGQIVKNPDNTYNLTFKDGRVHKFDATGRLLWQKDRNGNQTTLNYTSNQLTSVVDAFGRTLTVAPNANGTVSQISDSLGSITYSYEPTNPALLKTVTYSDGSKYQFEYDTTSAPGRILLKTVKDAVGNILETHDYDNQARATASGRDVGGTVERYTLDYTNANASTDSHTIVTDALGRVTKYYLDRTRGRNVVIKTEGVCGCGGGSEVTTYEYDTKLNLTKKRNALQQDSIYTYDANGNALTASDVFGTQKFTYNSYGQVLTYKDRIDSQNPDPNVKTAVMAYDANGNLTSFTDALGKVTTIAYPITNNKGLPDSITDARNNTTTFKWLVGSSLLEEIEDPYSKKTKFTYDARGRVKTITNALNHVTQYNYFDDIQRKVELIYPNLDKITYKYDIRRKLESVADERGKITSYEFDSAYRLKKITDPLAHVKEFGYDLMSNATSYKDPLGNVTDYRYDDFNRLKEIEHPAASSGGARLKERFEYDKLGRIKKQFDTADHLTEYAYNDAMRTNSVTNAELEVTTIKYNQRFQVFEVKDAINQVYTFTYDPLGRLLTQTRAGGTTSFVHDAVGNLEKRTDYIGRDTKYTHDKLNRLTEIEYIPMTVAGAQPLPSSMPNHKSTYGYDDISRLTSATNEVGTVAFGYDNRNRTTSSTDVFGHTINYEYELTSTVNQKRLKFDGAMYAVYNFDDADRLTNIVNSSDSSTVAFGYDNEDKLISRAYPNGVTTIYQYFDNDLLKRVTDANSSTELFDRQYSYNSARQISQIVEPTRARTLGYDNVNRLTSVTDATSGNESYTFDDVGNRLSSHLASSYGYQAGQFNRLISATGATQSNTYSHDANGNTTTKSEGSNFWRYTWDYENRLVEASTRKEKVRYKFDALGRRVQRVRGGGRENTKFIHDGDDVLVDDNGGTLTKYQNGIGVDDKLRMQTNSTVNYFLSVHLGSTSGLTDSNGSITASTIYDSFGNQAGTLGTRYGYTGRERDDFTGLLHYRARSYDSKLGRFISEDPVNFNGGDINLYAYVWNDPQTFTDPSGLSPIIKLARRMAKKGHTYIYDTGKELTMKQAQNVRRNGGEVIVSGRGASRVRDQVETGAFKRDRTAGDQLKHEPHGDNAQFLPHAQTNKKEGHTFSREAGIIFAPNIVTLSEDGCTTSEQFASAIAWDTIGLADPIGLTDAIDAYTGLDGGPGGIQGLGNFASDMAHTFMPMQSYAIDRFFSSSP